MRIKTKILVSVFTPVLLFVLIAVGISLYFFTIPELKQQAYDRLELAAMSRVNRINSYFEERKNDLEFLASSSQARQLLNEEYVENVTRVKIGIKARALEVGEQVDEYIREHPEMTVKDLQNDQEFQQIAVQKVGETGYTALTDYTGLICRFHDKESIVDLDLHSLAEKLPGFWSVMSKTEGGQVSDGFYNWQEPDGSIRKKYMYIVVIEEKTADGVGLHVAATTYIEEYGLSIELFKQTEDYLTGFYNIHDYENIITVKPNGEILWLLLEEEEEEEEDISDNLLDDDYKERKLSEVFKLVIGNQETAIVDYGFHEHNNQFVFYMGTLIYDEFKQEILGVLILEIGANEIDKILDDETGLGETGETYLIGSDYLMRSNSRFIEESTILKQKIETENAERCLDMLKMETKEHMGHEASGIFIDYRGINVLGTHYPIQEVNWCLLAEMDENEALKILNDQTKMAIIMAIVMSGLVFVVVGMVSRQISKPIEKLQQGAEIFEKGNLDHLVKIESKDEFGELAKVFNHMAGKLKVSYGQLTEKVREKTAELVNKVKELEKMNALMIDRELKMTEMKKEREELKSKTKKEGDE